MLKYTVDYRSFENALSRFPAIFQKESRVTIKDQLTKVQKRAAIIHRYTTRSGALSKAFELLMKGAFIGELILSKTVSNAPYSYAIHEGRKDWKNYRPDRFLINSFNHLRNDIESALHKVVSNSIRKAGLR